MKTLFYILLLFFATACNNKQPSVTQNIITQPVTKATGTQTSADSLKPPVIKQAGIPTLKKRLQPPVVNTLPIVVTDLSGLAAPDQSPAAIGNFATFTTDQGLALDAIISGFKDNKGDLWFGTVGGGVSRYDGKFFTNFTTQQGLANNIVFSITQDSKGNLWFGTDGGGVSRYDGKSFTNFTTQQGLANNIVRSITQDSKGYLWFGTYGGGVSRYDPSAKFRAGSESFTNFTTQQGLTNNTVFCITEDSNGNLWFGTDGGGVSRYDGKSFTNFTTQQGLANNNVRSITQDSTGYLWFGTNGGGVSRYDPRQDVEAGGKSFTNFTTQQGLANNIVLSITQDSKGDLWFGTYGGGVSRYHGKSFTNFTTQQGLANNIVLSITQDSKGNLWFGTYGGGVSRYYGKSFTYFTTQQGLINNTVLSITQDSKGNLWFGTYGGGVSRYDGKSFTNYTTQQGLANNNVFSITQDSKGNLWFGTDGGGVSRYDGKSFTNFTTQQGLANNNVRSITQDSKGNLWFGTYGGGVSRYDGNSFTNFTTQQGLANNNVGSIIQDSKGNLWFGTSGGGVSRYDPSAKLRTGSESFAIFTTQQGLANNTVLSITQDSKGNLWFGTYGGGVSRYDGNSFMNFTKLQGLPDDVVTQVVITKQGIAIGTNFGVGVLTNFSKVPNFGKVISAVNSLSNAELKNYTPVIEIYNASTGYPIKDVNSGQNGMMLDNEGIIWAGTGSDKTGLVRFDYAALNKNTEPPVVLIQNVKLNNENICWFNQEARLKNQEASSKADELSTNTLRKSAKSAGDSLSAIRDSMALLLAQFYAFGKTVPQEILDSQQTKFSGVQFDGITRFYPLPENLVLPYEHNNVSFDFNAIETGKPYLVNYQYMLEGYDKEWSPLTKTTSATFGNIYEGNYTFKLKAQSPEGVWCKPVEYKFRVLPPWWRTWWMYTAYGIFAVTLIVVIVWWNGRRLRAKAIELTEEVQKATSTIVEQKKVVEVQKKIVEEKHKEITDSINYAERIQRSFLASKELLNENLNEYFVFFQPKDVVSGDFYWASKLDNGTFALATADSTGHGVPGAIMSILNISSLEKAVEQGFCNPSEILNQTRKTIIERLKKDGSPEGGKDGMDASLICFDFANKKCTYSAANNPIWVIRENNLIELKPDKMPVGKNDKDQLSFTLNEFQLQKGDAVYTLTDGFPDQFGGSKGKKFMSKQLKDFLLSISPLPMHEQKQKLNETFDNWKGNLEQVDDVCVIGFRV